MNAQTAMPHRFSPEHGSADSGRRAKDMKVNGQPERWLVAARLSRVAKRDRERGDALITGIQTQDKNSTDWAQHEGHVIVT